MRLSSRAALFSAAVLLVLGISVYPMLTMLLKSVRGPQGFTLGYFGEIFRDPANLRAILQTFTVSSAATVLALVFGTALAFLVVRTDVPGRGFLKILAVVPLFVPPFVYAMAWQQLFNPAGYLNKLYMAVSGSDTPLFNIYGPLGIILVMATESIAPVFLITEGAFRQMDRALEEAGMACGARPARVLRDITLPVMLPNLMAAAVVVFITEISNFGIPAVLGFPVSYYVMTTRIYQVLQEFYRADNFSAAAAMSVLLLLLAVLSLWLKDRAVRRGRYGSAQPGGGVQARVGLGALRVPVFGAASLLLLLSAVAPVVAIVLTALTRAYGLPPFPGNLTLANFAEIFGLSLTKRAIFNSLKLSVAASTICVAIGAVIAYMLVRTDWKIKKWLDIAAAMPYTIPGTIVALAMILAFSRPVFGVSLYNTFWIILVAYVARYLFFAVRTVSAAMARVNPSLEEAARISGAGWLRSVRDTLLPQIKNSVVSAWVLIFAHTISELTVSILLWSVGNETVAVAVFNLQETGEITVSSALAVVLLAVSMGSYLLSERLK